ncbi:LacI family DNA-binding transcriptional regulator [Kineococcus gynurae]|uniref:LacI family DNA-binding transcriptional regulator n=1 Tax=Kineococcus gynurae TaxID=452979 RepID=A0ABV5LWT5_9ACTN
MKRATSRDVAVRAGVSRSAVSMVLNGKGDGNIAADKQAAILAAAAELEYTPNSVARSLRTQRTHTLGLVTDAIASSAFGGLLLQGASEAAAAAGYAIVLVDTHDHPEREADAYRTLLDRRVDAVLFAAMSLRTYEPPAAMSEVTSVLANCFDSGGRVRGYVPAEVAGGRTAASLLLDAGHRDVVLLAGTPDAMAGALRAEGFQLERRERGLPPGRVVETGWQIDHGYAAAMQVLAAPDRPTGILCANDRVAIGVALAAARLGLDVPGDLSLVGYDDDENVAGRMVPGLTTVALPHREMGESAVRHLLDRVRGDVSPSAGPAPQDATVLVPCPPVVRDSVAPPSPR